MNDPPTAVDDATTVAEDSAPTAIDVLANDSTAPDVGETLTITAVTQGTNGGTVVITGSGTGLAYSPNANFFGTDTFTYTISDGNGGTDTATVSITVTAINDPPLASAGTDQAVAVTATVQLDGGGSSDADEDLLTFQWTLRVIPAGSAVLLSDPNAESPIFVADQVGTYNSSSMTGQSTASRTP